MARSTEVDLIVKAVAQGFQGVQSSFGTLESAEDKLAVKTAALTQRQNELAKAIASGDISISDAADEMKRLDESMPVDRVNEGNTSFTELAAKLSIAQAAFGAVAGVAKEAYETIGEGAGLIAAEQKFSNLSESIGTTADVLLGRLKSATSGMISDADLMAGATDLINLGLARNEDQAVRLGTAVGALGLDLQVLGLTLANDSTARLDSLGLSMEDVKKKAAELQAQGFTGDAFDEAVLIGLEEKMALFGDASETTAGKLAIMEASWANLTNNLKTGLASALEPAITSAANLTTQFGEMQAAAKNTSTPLSNTAVVLNEISKALGFPAGDKFVEQLKEWERGSELTKEELAAVDEQLGVLDASMSRYIDSSEEAVASNRNVYDGLTETADQLAYAALVANDYTSAGEETVVTAEDMAEAEQRRADALEEATRKTEEAEKAAMALAAEQKRLSEQSGDLFTQYADATDGFEFFSHSLDTMGEQFVMVGGRTSEQSEQLEDLQSAYEKAAGVISDYELGLKGVTLTEEERNKKIAEQQEIMANATEAMQPLIAIQGELQAVNNELAIDYDAVNAAMISAADASGASAEQLAVLRIATGDLSEAQAEALLKQVAIQQSIEALGKAYADGSITLQEYVGQARSSVEEINAMDFSFNLEEGTVITPQVDTSVASEQLAVVRDEAIAAAEGYDSTTEGTAALDEASIALNETLGQTITTTADLQGSYANVTTQMIDLQREAYGVNEAIGAIPKEVTVTITVNQVGSVPQVPGARAVGGPVTAGMPYVVGERGPEMFVPNTGGAIVTSAQTAGMGGGGFTLNGNIIVQSSSADPGAVAQAVPDKLMAAYKGRGRA